MIIVGKEVQQKHPEQHNGGRVYNMRECQIEHWMENDDESKREGGRERVREREGVNKRGKLQMPALNNN